MASASCPTCRSCEFTLLRFAGAYVGALRANVLFLKRHPHICSRMRALILDTFEQNRILLSAECLLPVPLHPLRLKERGFNQAELVAKIIACRTGIRLDVQTITRIKHTVRHRAGMDVHVRRKSVTAAFAVTQPDRVRDRIVLLVDDVLTTGATLNACSRVLLDAGARAVYAFTVARVISEGLLRGDRGSRRREVNLEVSAGRS